MSDTTNQLYRTLLDKTRAFEDVRHKFEDAREEMLAAQRAWETAGARDYQRAKVALREADADASDALTKGAKLVIELAVDEARRLNHAAVDPEHMLLGVMRGGSAADMLSGLGVNLGTMRSAIDYIITKTQPCPENGDDGDIGLSWRAKRVIEMAVDEARLLNHGAVAPEHILIGIAGECDGVAGGLLEGVGVNRMRLCREVGRHGRRLRAEADRGG